MTRIFWDTMLFIYLFQADAQFGDRVAYLRRRSQERGDEICTSALALGEILAGVLRDKSSAEAARVRAGIQSAGVRILPFDASAADTFGRIRVKHRTSAADSIHLACAAAAGIDLFLTGDKNLTKLHIPGIKFIDGLDTGLL
ncbi:MAG TPA: PIN domain-containing protein [Granulicella sp.]|jgi:predicted nucleic acid-binding protein|nr:PIN domain-containing protein [Granulicella sp.]